MDWCDLSHVYAGIFSLVKAKNTDDIKLAIEYEDYALARLECLEQRFKGMVSFGPRKFDTVSSLNVNMAYTT